MLLGEELLDVHAALGRRAERIDQVAVGRPARGHGLGVVLGPRRGKGVAARLDVRFGGLGLRERDAGEHDREGESGQGLAVHLRISFWVWSGRWW